MVSFYGLFGMQSWNVIPIAQSCGEFCGISPHLLGLVECLKLNSRNVSTPIAIMSSKSDFKCCPCNKQFPSGPALRSHRLATHATPREQPLHLLTEREGCIGDTGVGEDMLECHTCSISFASASVLLLHCQHAHPMPEDRELKLPSR